MRSRPTRIRWIAALLGFLSCLALLSAGRKSTPSGEAPSSELDRFSRLVEGVPHVCQEPDSCGEACVASWLRKIGVSADQTVPNQPGFSDADFAQHIIKLKERLPGNEFQILIEPPFVVISDASAEQTRRRAEGTVRWATTSLKQAYFSKDPEQILDIWLFKDKSSYDLNNVRLFGSQPSTPFGYYSPSEGALVMNIATGGGTLVHEIVHPFMESNFPECPAWFNEGLGSLYEQSRSREGQIIGMTNWRLAGLQKAIREKSVPSFRELCSTTTDQFYNADRGTNYAQARYLCYYLQEHDLLHRYYHAFVKNHRNDPTGYKTLKETLAVEDMDRFQQEWEAYVMELRFNG